jgi:hypothetical protein
LGREGLWWGFSRRRGGKLGRFVEAVARVLMVDLMVDLMKKERFFWLLV